MNQLRGDKRWTIHMSLSKSLTSEKTKQNKITSVKVTEITVIAYLVKSIRQTKMRINGE